jgi:hypothetical protein
MNSQGMSRSRVRPLILLAVLVVMVVTGLLLAIRGSEDAEAQSSRRVLVTVNCSVVVPSTKANCTGRWRMSGGWRDSGIIRAESTSSDGGAYLRGTLRSRRGRLGITSGAIYAIHSRRRCRYSSSFNIGSGSTGRYANYRGGGSTCTKVSFRRGRMYRTDTFRATLVRR